MILGTPIRIAAIDAGSNGVRLVVAQANSGSEIQVLDAERAAVRLGHRAFTKRRFSRLTISQAIKAFRHFRTLLDKYGVQRYRAVATSAAREARNRDELIGRIRRATGIELEVINSAEESRLVRSAILGTIGQRLLPRLIVDLGGGSLEISVLRNHSVEKGIALPLGTVRLMETLKIYEAFSEEEFERVQRRVLSQLQRTWPAPPDLSGEVAVASGGNAEALARILPGPRIGGIPSVNLRLLRSRIWEVLGLGVEARMKEFHIRRDRAEVIGVAAIVLTVFSRYLGLRTLLVPGVGVKEGILRDLASSVFSPVSAGSYAARFRPLLRGARRVAARFHYEPVHAEHVRRLAGELFDQLSPVHGLPYDLRGLLEMAAILHDVGYAINSEAHHKHGEYIVRNAVIKGLPEQDRFVVACLVRYHGKAIPRPQHKLYSSLDARVRRRVQALAGLLRIAVALDKNHTQAVQGLVADSASKPVRIQVFAASDRSLPIGEFRHAARLFEETFGRRVRFGRARTRREPAREKSAEDSHRAA